MDRVQKLITLLSTLVVALIVAGYCNQLPIARASEVAVLTNQTLLSAAATDETASTPVGPAFLSRCRESAFYIAWGTGVTSGVVEVESAHDTAYAGTWAPLAVVTFSGTAPKVDIVQITGVHAALRNRISTVVANGTVTTIAVCN